MKEKLEAKLTNGFLYEGFEHNGVEYKPLTARSMVFLAKIGSSIYTGQGDDSDELTSILEYMFAVSKTTKELTQAMDSWQETLFDYAEQFSPDDLLMIGEIISKDLDNSTAAIVEAREDIDEKK